MLRELKDGSIEILGRENQFISSLCAKEEVIHFSMLLLEQGEAVGGFDGYSQRVSDCSGSKWDVFTLDSCMCGENPYGIYKVAKID